MAGGVRELIGRAPTARAQLPYGAAALVGLAVHVVLLASFAALGVWPMAAFNVGSVACFVLVFALFRRGRLPLALALAILEVIVHQVLAVSYCGWEPGFQYYLLSVTPLSLMLPTLTTRAGGVFALFPLAAFLGLALVFGMDPRAVAYPIAEPWAHYIGLFNLIFAFGILWIFVAFYRHGAEVAEGELAVVVSRNEAMLHGILPAPIVDRLREEPGVIADRFEDVTVLFTHLVGFTQLASSMSADDLVRLLDELFGLFDDLVQARGLEKIKTIGDAYMVAGGIPEPREDHVEAIAALALELRDAVRDYAERRGIALQIRIGIHTGPVVAGVIGKTKFAYDLWGDAVNTAARMESHGAPGRVHVTRTVAERLRETHALEARGAVEVKGKGAMETYWLEARARPAR